MLTHNWEETRNSFDNIILWEKIERINPIYSFILDIYYPVRGLYYRLTDLHNWFESDWDKINKINLYTWIPIFLCMGVIQFIKNILSELDDIITRPIKRGLQRGYRGWSDEDVWNCDSYFAKIIYKMLNNKKYGNRYQ
jgi:hypothetical protein